MSARVLCLAALLSLAPVTAVRADKVQDQIDAALSDQAPKDEKPSAPPQPLTKEQKDAAGAVLKTLRRLEAAVTVGLNVTRYGDRVIDAKADVNEQIGPVPAGPVKDNLLLALTAYEDAHTFWNGLIELKYKTAVKKSPRLWGIITSYDLPGWRKWRYLDAVREEDKALGLTALWQFASAKLKLAEAGLNQ